MGRLGRLPVEYGSESCQHYWLCNLTSVLQPFFFPIRNSAEFCCVRKANRERESGHVPGLNRLSAEHSWIKD